MSGEKGRLYALYTRTFYTAYTNHHQALSEFADYVEAQQAKRYPGAISTRPSTTVSTTTASLASTSTSIASTFIAEHHDELDILNQLDLGDDVPKIRLKELLLSTDDEGLNKLVEVVKERLDEEHGETLFEIGYEDDGTSQNLSKSDYDTALARLTAAAKKETAELQVLLTHNVGGDLDGRLDPKYTACDAKILIRRHPASVESVIETRIAVVGNVDAGKSTMLGVLVKGGLDDGRGKARVNLFRHKHEIESGRTSSVGMEIMGFSAGGEIIKSSDPARKLSWEDIGKRSAKVISFTDLAGHEKYLRTTVFGMLSSSPNYCLLMVAANNGLIGMSKEHLGIALALNIPIMVVITKIDICPPNVLKTTLSQIRMILKSPGANKIAMFINSHEEAVNTAVQFISKRICPIFQVSNVTGKNLDLVRTFLNILPHHGHYDAEGPFEFHINDTFSVPFVGTVVSGIIKSGTIHVGDPIIIGPDSLGHFSTTKVRSIERKRISVPAASAGQSASFALHKIRRKDVRKGMVVLPKPSEESKGAAHTSGAAKSGTQPQPGELRVYREFIAEVLILSHATTIQPGYQAMLHVGPVQQTCTIIDIDRLHIRTGDRATVAFRFVQRPEYLVAGDRILFREGRTKGLGIVKSVGYDPQHPLNPNKKPEEGTPGAHGKEDKAARETAAKAAGTGDVHPGAPLKKTKSKEDGAGRGHQARMKGNHEHGAKKKDGEHVKA